MPWISAISTFICVSVYTCLLTPALPASQERFSHCVMGLPGSPTAIRMSPFLYLGLNSYILISLLIYMYLYTYTRTYICTSIFYASTYLYFILIYIYIYIYTYIYVFICMYVCMYVCMYNQPEHGNGLLGRAIRKHLLDNDRPLRLPLDQPALM